MRLNKGFEMEGLSWFIQVGPECNHIYPYMGETRVDLTQIHREKVMQVRANRDLKMLVLKVGEVLPGTNK